MAHSIRYRQQRARCPEGTSMRAYRSWVHAQHQASLTGGRRCSEATRVWIADRCSPVLLEPVLMFAVKGFDQASAFWFSPGAVFLDDVFIQVTDASPFDRADMDEHIGAAGVGL